MDNLLQTLIGRMGMGGQQKSQVMPKDPAMGPAIQGTALPAPPEGAPVMGAMPMGPGELGAKLAEFAPVGGESLVNAARTGYGAGISKGGTMPKFEMGNLAGAEPRIQQAIQAARNGMGTPYSKMAASGQFAGDRTTGSFKEGGGGLSELLPILMQRMKGGQ